MRLIDADALLENQPKGCYRTSDWINAAPTIDAIPVEWLRRWRDVTDIPLLAMNIDSILKVWEESNKYWGEVNKKQEAR